MMRGGHSSPTYPGPDFFLTSCAGEHRQSLQDDWGHVGPKIPSQCLISEVTVSRCKNPT
ncbi:hypothetical protein CGRA01v4_07483 [Colletotrichum graminicola]|nr:hypothetical protein CGRA01v4_07483 [Colletotrichum graminicola]